MVCVSSLRFLALCLRLALRLVAVSRGASIRWMRLARACCPAAAKKGYFRIAIRMGENVGEKISFGGCVNGQRYLSACSDGLNFVSEWRHIFIQKLGHRVVQRKSQQVSVEGREIRDKTTIFIIVGRHHSHVNRRPSWTRNFEKWRQKEPRQGQLQPSNIDSDKKQSCACSCHHHPLSLFMDVCKKLLGCGIHHWIVLSTVILHAVR